MKGQASIELLITLGVVLAFSIPVLFLLFSISSVGYENTGIAQAEASARSLSDSINMVYSQGPGAKRVILLNLPAKTRGIEISEGGEVIVTVGTSSGDFEAAFPTFAEIRGDLSLSRDEGMSGLVSVEIIAQEDSEGVYVEVGLVD